MRHRFASILFAGLLALITWMPAASAIARTATPASSIQPYLDRVANRITEFTLNNGIKFIVLERHQAPIVSFMTYVNIGSAYEETGKTGAAHFLEHLAFKGTTRIGTTSYQAEKPLLDRLDVLSEQIQAAQAAGRDANALQQEFEQTKAQAASYVNQNEFGKIVQQAGGVGLNATTSADATRYFYSFPSNKLELWMSLESERFLDPVFREFYEEKEVILEERRMRTDNSPIGKMIEEFLGVALPSHPYGRPVIGSEQDIQALTRQDIQKFFQRYYTPNHIVMSIVGDVDPAQVKELAQAYFGRYQARSQAPVITAPASTQTEPKEITLTLPSQPWYLEGYQRPDLNNPDNAIYQVLSGVLTGGRTARLYRSLVEQQQLALSVSVADSFPGNRYSNLMLLYALTAPGHTLDEVAAALDTELTRLKTEPISAEELDRLKTQAKASLIQTLSSNSGMASLLSEYEAKTGSWRNVFAELQAIEAVTAADVQRVAQALFQPQNLTIGKLLSSQ
ncbi:insulinase family protein [Phormidium tenue FACHB-886]|nr:insulinase family protein [Phormidium tenue FACHB-886]